MILHGYQQSKRVEIRDHQLASLKPIQPVVLRTRQIHLRRLIQNRQTRQRMPLPKRKVIRVVRRRHLHGACPKLGIRPVIRHNRNLTVWQPGHGAKRQRKHLPDQSDIPLVRRVHGNRRIAQHRLRPRRCNDHRTRAIGQRIPHVVQLAHALLVLHLQVRHRSLQLRIPVDDVRPAIDQALLIQPDKRLNHRWRQRIVHREIFTRPVDARPQPPHLVRDGSAILLLPRPNFLCERLAAKLLARSQPLRGKLLLHHHLCCDPRVIRTRNPKRTLAQHAMPARQNIHLRLVQHVPHVQPASHVRRRQQHGEDGT